jgi:hypothetical protein
MKKYLFLTLLSLLIINYTQAQSSCTYCFRQNIPVAGAVNNLILNGSFELGCTNVMNTFICPNSSNYSCDLDNWICTGGGSSTYASLFTSTSSIIVDGQRAAYLGNYFANACSPTTDDTSCLQTGNCEILGIPAGYPTNGNTYGGNTGISIQQTVNGLTPGVMYVLEFWAGGESGGGIFANTGIFAVDIGYGNIMLRCRPTEGNTNDVGSRYIIEFAASGTSQTIKFTNWGHIRSTATEVILDDVRMYRASELPSYIPACILALDEEIAEPMVTVYPNPATSVLNIKVNQNTPTEIGLYDLVGRKLLAEKLTANTVVNIEHLANGIYIYQIQNKNGVIKTGRFIKE